MTTDELRDWHAREAGWGFPGDFAITSDGHTGVLTKYRLKQTTVIGERLPDRVQADHPFPPTRDGAASVMPEGFVWVREYSTSSDYEKYEKGLVLTWNAYGQHEEAVKCDDTGDEIHDRYLLAKLAKEAMNANPR